MDKVYVVYRREYGNLNGDMLLYICATPEIAESYRKLELGMDLDGMTYVVIEMDLKTKIAPKLEIL